MRTNTRLKVYEQKIAVAMHTFSVANGNKFNWARQVNEIYFDSFSKPKHSKSNSRRCTLIILHAITKHSKSNVH